MTDYLNEAYHSLNICSVAIPVCILNVSQSAKGNAELHWNTDN